MCVMLGQCCSYAVVVVCKPGTGVSIFLEYNLPIHVRFTKTA